MFQIQISDMTIYLKVHWMNILWSREEAIKLSTQNKKHQSRYDFKDIKNKPHDLI